MSTTIGVYPTTAFMPLVEQTRARTQKLFQYFLNQHGIGSTIEVKAFYPSSGDDPVTKSRKYWHKITTGLNTATLAAPKSPQLGMDWSWLR